MKILKTKDRRVCICEGVHTSRESSRFQITLIPSLASTETLDEVPLTVTPNVTNGSDTLQKTESENETDRQKQQPTQEVRF